MKKLLLLSVLVAGQALALNEIKNADKKQEKAGLEKVVRATKPTVLYIYADWCKYCNKELVEKAEKAFPKISFVAINNDTIKNNDELKPLLNDALAKAEEGLRLGTMGLPTYIFINNGKYIKKSGGMDEKAFLALVEEFAKGKLISDAEMHAEWDRLVQESKKNLPAKKEKKNKKGCGEAVEEKQTEEPKKLKTQEIKESIIVHEEPIKVAAQVRAPKLKQMPKNTTSRRSYKQKAA